MNTYFLSFIGPILKAVAKPEGYIIYRHEKIHEVILEPLRDYMVFHLNNGKIFLNADNLKQNRMK